MVLMLWPIDVEYECRNVNEQTNAYLQCERSFHHSSILPQSSNEIKKMSQNTTFMFVVMVPVIFESYMYVVKMSILHGKCLC